MMRNHDIAIVSRFRVARLFKRIESLNRISNGIKSNVEHT
eukprot:UN13729